MSDMSLRGCEYVQWTPHQKETLQDKHRSTSPSHKSQAEVDLAQVRIISAVSAPFVGWLCEKDPIRESQWLLLASKGVEHVEHTIHVHLFCLSVGRTPFGSFGWLVPPGCLSLRLGWVGWLLLLVPKQA